MSRCCECRKPVLVGQPKIERQGPAGLNMNRIHRIVTNVWHEACWATASEWADRVRAETRALQLRDSFDLGRRVGMSVAECAEIARGNGWSEDEIAAASA